MTARCLVFALMLGFAASYKVVPGAVFALRLPFCEDATLAAVDDNGGNMMYILRPNVETEDAEDVECYYDHDLDGLKTTGELLACIEHEFEEVSLTQRICEDRIENPHGEHAEDVFILKAAELRRFLWGPEASTHCNE